MPSEYFSTTDYVAQKQYLQKLVIDGETVPDPYGITQNLWLDNVTTWPNLGSSDLYNFLPD